MAINTVAVTGGNGRIGSAVIGELNDRGYTTVNLNRGKQKTRVVDDADGADHYCRTQMLEAGEVYGALAKFDVDAAIHLASIPNPLSNVGYQTYESNVMGAYHVLEAATALEFESVCLPSSINVMGSSFQEPPMEVEYLPVDEDHPVTPRDPYATSKHALEVTADGFGRQQRPPTTIASIRYPWVATDEELETVVRESDRTLGALSDPDVPFTRDDLFAYIHVDDAAVFACEALEANFEGHERFWAVADDTLADTPSSRLQSEFYPDVDVRESLDGNAALVSTAKARELTGWEPTRTWRDGGQ